MACCYHHWPEVHHHASHLCMIDDTLPDFIVSGATDGHIICWTLKDTLLLHEWDAHPGDVTAITAPAYPSARAIFASAGGDHLVKMWTWDVVAKSKLMHVESPFLIIHGHV